MYEMLDARQMDVEEYLVDKECWMLNRKKSIKEDLGKVDPN